MDQLFTRYFLSDGIKGTAEWQESVNRPEAFIEFRDEVQKLHEKFSRLSSPNESLTEQDLIRPTLDLLGWEDYLPQQGTERNEDIPDHLLFADAEAKAQAGGRENSADRYLDALVVQESKRFGLALSSREKGNEVQRGTPHGQILRYLDKAAEESNGRIRWGILTNGCVWRLYDHRARPRASGYYEVNLAELFEANDEDRLRVFLLLFRREAFTPREETTTTFLEDAIAEGRRYEERVAQDLSGVVFDTVFPDLVRALAQESEQDLSEIRDAALIFLYRLLFVLYAEDRGLLPVNDPRYDDYGLRKPVRDDVAGRMEQHDTFSATAANYYNRLSELFRLIDQGDPSIGLPPYNGGLFASETASLLERVRLSDKAIAPIIHALSHSMGRYVNYRDMSVQQLGSIYERLLEREPVRDDSGNVVIIPNPSARKDSGSFYTPQELVDLIVERTLKPLTDECWSKFKDKSEALKNDCRSEEERSAELRALDPAEAVLNLKVLDPAMGSGHFLVTAVDFLSDRVAELMERAPTMPQWLSGEYAPPLEQRVKDIRADILKRAEEFRWNVNEAQLSDVAIIRRMVLKQCIYGVDKNRLTVELAKVSLWLHTFTVGAPLSFLDHHLRCGDSLIGSRVSSAVKGIEQFGQVFTEDATQRADSAAELMQRIEGKSDADIAEVSESAALFEDMKATVADLQGLLDFVCGFRWLTAGMTQRELSVFRKPLSAILGENPKKAYGLLSRGPEHMPDVMHSADDTSKRFAERWHEVMAIAQQENFFHWEVAFPSVWGQQQGDCPDGGFDAVVGNPPWDRIKLQEVEWFAFRAPDIARAPTGAERKAAIKQLRSNGDPLAAQFDMEKQRADEFSQYVRRSGSYPLLGRGDINLYSLFVERAMSLVKPNGLIGLLTPSGIYGDKTAARFFQKVSTDGRVAGVFDFENRRSGSSRPSFFPAVDSRFKFCALIFGGEKRKFSETSCAFFLHDTSTIDDSGRCFPLTPDDFARVNPNTGTAPVFRSQRDADITRYIYERHPVLVDKSQDQEISIYPTKYTCQFHMTNDSDKFRTAAQLKDESFYPVAGNRWKKGDVLYLPLYEGKMVQAYDHRAASVTVNPSNLSRPASPHATTLAEHANRKWLPNPQFWVDANTGVRPERLHWSVAFKHVTSPTNVRTMIACIAPCAGFGNSLPILTPVDQSEDAVEAYKATALFLVANLNAFAFDFIARQKVQGQNLNWFIVEQLPVIALDAYDRKFGNTTARELVLDHVLRLTYTACDMASFACDLGYDGQPFIWNAEDRHHLQARLDALYFHLYGIEKDDAAYMLNTFSIIRRKEEKNHGRYRTRDLILAYMNALAAGDTTTKVVLSHQEEAIGWDGLN